MIFPATLYSTTSSKVRTVQLTFTSSQIEIDDNTNLSGELACAGGACEIK